MLLNHFTYVPGITAKNAATGYGWDPGGYCGDIEEDLVG